MILSGKFLSALMASPATQHTKRQVGTPSLAIKLLAICMMLDNIYCDLPASKPKYPKNDEIAPRITPDAPNSGGMKGVKLDLSNRIKPPIVMKATSNTFNHVKISVTIFSSTTCVSFNGIKIVRKIDQDRFTFDSLTPTMTRTVVAIDTKHAIGLMPNPG